jgi:N-methylhydantoinase A
MEVPGVNHGWIGIDTGGTFTDLVLVTSDGQQWFHKIPTSPADPSTGILSGVKELLGLARMQAVDVRFLCHGTTLATNAVLEGKWARTGMITTAGFRDVLELARQRRPSFFNLDIAKPMPPAERDLRIEVSERLAYDGSCITALDEKGVRTAVEAIREAGCAAVSICFLHAYANPAHERRAAAIALEAWPDA